MDCWNRKEIYRFLKAMLVYTCLDLFESCDLREDNKKENETIKVTLTIITIQLKMNFSFFNI